MSNIFPFPEARRARVVDLAHPHPSALIIVASTKSVADQMRQHAVFPTDDVFTDADGFLGNRSGDA